MQGASTLPQSNPAYHHNPDTSSLPAVVVSGAPEELQNVPQWVAWRFGEVRPNGKRPKEPINPHNGHKADTTDASTWATFTEANASGEMHGCDGVGFVFSREDEYVGIDLDGCIDPDTGEAAPWAMRIVEQAGSYAEVSPSGTGIKIVGRGSLPTEVSGKKKEPVEVYQHSRFFTVTGRALDGYSQITDVSEVAEKLYKTIEAEQRKGKAHDRLANAAQGNTTATAGFSGDDAKLIEKAARKPMFRALFYNGDASGFSSRSEADLALLGTLAFWTGKDSERMDRLFRQSALMRPKWTRQDYRSQTIEKAISRCRNTYTGGTAAREGDGKVRERFHAEREAVERLPFDWRGGDSDYKLSHALIDTGGVCGTAGAEVAVAERDLQLKAAIGGRETVRRGVERLIERGLIEQVHPGGKHTAATYRLKFSEASPEPSSASSNLDHSDTPPHCVYYGPGLTTVRTDVTRMRGQYTPPRKSHDKNGRPIPVYQGHPEKRASPRVGQIRSYLRSHPGADLHEIAGHLGKNTRDGRYNLKRREIHELVSFEFAYEQDGGYYLYDSHAERFEQYLEDSGCNAMERRQHDRIERERLAYELHDATERISYEVEQAGYDPAEPEPMPEEATSEATESAPTPSDESTRGVVPEDSPEPEILMYAEPHSRACLCYWCVPMMPEPDYARPRPLPTDTVVIEAAHRFRKGAA